LLLALENPKICVSFCDNVLLAVPNPRQVASQEHVLPQFSTFPWLKGPRLQITLNFGAQISALKLANGWGSFPDLLGQFGKGKTA
jgi:hypothetical protein